MKRRFDNMRRSVLAAILLPAVLVAAVLEARKEPPDDER